MISKLQTIEATFALSADDEIHCGITTVPEDFFTKPLTYPTDFLNELCEVMDYPFPARDIKIWTISRFP